MSGTDQKLKTVAIDPSVSGSQTQPKSLSFLQARKSSKGMSLSRLRVRKQSYGFGAVPSVGGQMRRRSSQLGMEFKRPPLLFLNTYQLEPHVKFHVANVTKAINSILDSFYCDFRYTNADSPLRTILIADEVMRTVKAMNFNRYRIISVVTLAQKRAQSYNNAVGFLWDHEFDSIVNIQREDRGVHIDVELTIKYLRLVLDSRWNFEEYFRRLAPKLDRTGAALKRLLPNLGGPDASCQN